MKRTWWLLAALLATCLIGFGIHEGEHALFQVLRETVSRLKEVGARAPLRTMLVYFAIYVATGAVSLPVAAVLTLAAGAMFGFWWGLLLAAISASSGAFAGFVVSRYLLHAAVERHFGARLAPVHKGLREEGAFYLFALRMVPVFPSWLANLLMGLTTMRPFTFWWVSALGLLPLEAAYTFAGTRLATISKPGDILSPGLIFAILGLGLVPLLLRRVVRWVELRYFKHDG